MKQEYPLPLPSLMVSVDHTVIRFPPKKYFSKLVLNISLFINSKEIQQEIVPVIC